jgi:ammonium transporter, Amt family
VRRGSPSFAPHNVLLTVVGAALLWFGWFGFNAGSALSSGGLAAMAFAVTNVAAASAALVWAIIEYKHRGKPTAVGIVSGAVAGLVGITPAAGFVSVGSALLIGAGAAAAGYFGVNVLKARLGYDDSLDVFGIHGLCGCWGAIATGLFASSAVNPAGADGLIHGNPGLVLKQAIAVVACGGAAALATAAILLVMRSVTPLRVTDGEEEIGLDAVHHGEPAYGFVGPIARSSDDSAGDVGMPGQKGAFAEA